MNMSLLDGTFFQLVSDKSTSTNIVATCIKCLPDNVEVKGYRNCTSNFVVHLKRKHGNDVVEEYRAHTKRKKTINISSKESKSSIYSKENFDSDMVKFFAHSMISLRCIENPYFVKILQNVHNDKSNLNIMSRRTLGRRLSEYYVSQKSQIETELRKIDYVCTTIDIWSGRKRSFLGVTAHWIIPEDLKRSSRALACRRFYGTHDFEQITQLVNEIHTEYGLNNKKIVSSTTDNGSNFVKAFKTFGVHPECITVEDNPEDNVAFLRTVAENSSDEEESLSTDDEQENVVDIDNLRLPLHLRCCSHTLNLIATADACKILKKGANTALSSIHQSVLNKCNILWKKSNRPKTDEIIKSTLGFSLTKPVETRWNSLYDSLKQILRCREKSTILHKALGLKNPLCDNEFEYIEEYLCCSKPIAEALDILQSEQNTYYGILLPTLLALRKNLQKLTRNFFLFCEPLRDIYLKNIEARFTNFFSLSGPLADNAIIAALSFPRFKNKWFVCVPSSEHSRLKNLFVTILSQQFCLESSSSEITQTITKEDEFFDFEDSESEISQSQLRFPRSKAEQMIATYFADENRDLDMLKKYPEIKNIFLQYNTPLPSSGPVERLFSYATMINCPKANRLSDQMFEKRVVLKANLNYCVQN